jgi:hypothetical protein
MAYAAYHTQYRQHHFRPQGDDTVTREPVERESQQSQHRKNRRDDDLQQQENQRAYNQHISPNNGNS